MDYTVGEDSTAGFSPVFGIFGMMKITRNIFEICAIDPIPELVKNPEKDRNPNLKLIFLFLSEEILLISCYAYFGNNRMKIYRTSLLLRHQIDALL